MVSLRVPSMAMIAIATYSIRSVIIIDSYRIINIAFSYHEHVKNGPAQFFIQLYM